jgi:hypothetical protein
MMVDGTEVSEEVAVVEGPLLNRVKSYLFVQTEEADATFLNPKYAGSP